MRPASLRSPSQRQSPPVFKSSLAPRWQTWPAGGIARKQVRPRFTSFDVTQARMSSTTGIIRVVLASYSAKPGLRSVWIA